MALNDVKLQVLTREVGAGGTINDLEKKFWQSSLDSNGELAQAPKMPSGASILTTFDTVADMVAANYLNVGDKVRTLGYYAAGDGGGNDYEIVAAATGTDDGGSYIDLAVHQAKGLFVGGVYSPKQFGAKFDNSTDDTSALNSFFSFVPSGALVNTGDAGDVAKFTSISLSSNLQFVGYGVFSGAAPGSKPSVATLRATNSAGRLVELQTYLASSITVTNNGAFKGVLNVSNALFTSSSNEIEFQGIANLTDCAFHGAGLKARFQAAVVNAQDLIVSDSPTDGVFIQRGAQVYMPFGYVLSSAKRGAHLQLSGFYEIQDGEIHDSVDENLFSSGKTEVVAKRAVFSNGQSIGVSMIYGGSGDLLEAVIQDNGGTGLSAESCSVILAEDCTITGNGAITGTGDGCNTSYQGFLQVRGATITGNTRFAAYALTGGLIQAQELTCDLSNNSGNEQFKALINGYIILDEPGTGGMSALSRTDCVPTYNTIGNTLGFIGDDKNHPSEDIGISVSRRTYGARDVHTISSGAISLTSGWALVETEASASTDDLDTITRDANYPVDEIVIQPNSTGQTITVKHNTGNLRTFSGADIVLSAKNKIATAMWSKSTAVWLVKEQ